MLETNKFQTLVKQLYTIVNELKSLFSWSPLHAGWTYDRQHWCYGLTLMTASNKGYDAVSKSGEKVEIKATQSRSAAFRSEPEHTIVIKLFPDGTFEEIYNGPGNLIWKRFNNKQLPSNGQYQISVNKLKLLNSQVGESQRLSKNDR